jgi:hypothetical protein
MAVPQLRRGGAELARVPISVLSIERILSNEDDGDLSGFGLENVVFNVGFWKLPDKRRTF